MLYAGPDKNTNDTEFPALKKVPTGGRKTRNR